MSGTLYVVATPIGNLEDITLRALRVLREASLIAAEDTRRTGKLLHHHRIDTRTISFHEHNSKGRLPELMTRLKAGDSIALVSDAGTPLLSDPGLDLVHACVSEGIVIDPVPGASAPLTALVASGFPAIPLTIMGFVPPKATARKRWLEALSATEHTVVFFEAPHRVTATLRDMAMFLGNRPLVVGREMSKVHQEFLRGTAAGLVDRLKNPRGELTFVVGPRLVAPDTDAVLPSPQELAKEFGQLTDEGGATRRQAIAELARRHHVPSRDVYDGLEKAKRLA